VCEDCTTGPLDLVPLCPETTVARKGPYKGLRIEHGCRGKHIGNPFHFAKGKCCAGRRAKRARRDGTDAPDAPEHEE
jgi:hypothetical protein